MLELVLGAALLGLITVFVVVRPLLTRGAREASRATRDVAVFRDQLAEVDRDRARGLISEAEAAGTRAEISRRLIAAAQRAEGAEGFGPAPQGFSRAMSIGAALGVPLVAGAAYLVTGAPGLDDQPFAARSEIEQRAALASLPGQRLSQAEGAALAAAQGRVPPPEVSPEADSQATEVARLAELIAQRPEDVEGRRLLAEAYMRRGRYGDAAELFGEMIRLQAPRIEGGLFTAQAEAYVMAAGGYVSPEAEQALRRALRLDARDPVARYYAGLALAQQGNQDQAITIWRQLYTESQPQDPWYPLVAGMLAQAGVPPPRPGGLDRDAVAAVAQMTPEEQAAFMAERMAALETRLVSEGGTVEEWVMMIRAYARSGRAADAV
ncbi:MAG: c-type cytochrome biogenesis protein CcmI, partial [Pikeienuella sp.]